MANSIVNISQNFFEIQATFQAKSISFETVYTKKNNERLVDQFEPQPAGKIKHTIEKFKKIGAPGGELDFSIRANQDELFLGTGDSKLERDLDLMLWLTAETEDEYHRLRARFKELFEISRKAFVNPPPSIVPLNELPQKSDTNAGLAENPEEFTKNNGSFEIEIHVGFKRVETRFEILDLNIQKSDPLVLDLAGNGFNLKSLQDGGYFDVNGDGQIDRTGWISGDDALLAFDSNKNGRIDNGRELFGDQNGAINGFFELAKHDKNGDNVIDQKDSIFKALKLYRDLNGNGVIDSKEVSDLRDAKIQSISLSFARDPRNLNGNSLILRGTFKKTDGSEGAIGDVLFGFRTLG